MSPAKMLCMLATVLVLSVDSYAQAPKVIAQMLCDQLDQANANHDLNRVLGFFDSNYVLTDERGKRMAFSEVQRQLEQNFSVLRRMNPSTTVKDVQLEAGRMVVSYRMEMHYELHDQRNGWVPQIYKSTGESTWERKGSEWKLVRETVFRADTQLDPKWVEEHNAWNQTVQEIVRRAGQVGGCHYPDCK